jgi:hypothetical protein
VPKGERYPQVLYHMRTQVVFPSETLSFSFSFFFSFLAKLNLGNKASMKVYNIEI